MIVLLFVLRFVLRIKWNRIYNPLHTGMAHKFQMNSSYNDEVWDISEDQFWKNKNGDSNYEAGAT
jgi:hypothetical protein